MTATVKISADGKLALPEALRKRKQLKPGSVLRITEAGESLLLTPVYPPTEEEFASVIQAAGGLESEETTETRKQVEAAIKRDRARARSRKN